LLELLTKDIACKNLANKRRKRLESMPTAAVLRSQIEKVLEQRVPAALTVMPRSTREVAATGIEAVDTNLDGGLPVGAISELIGPDSSGRTSLAFAFVAQCIDSEHVCAWVDVADALDPESAAASGVDLERLLWVRCRNVQRQSKAKPWAQLDQALRATDLLLQVGGFGAIVLDLGSTAPEHGSRIPLATWFRWRQAADRTRCCLVVLGKMAYAQSSADVVVECARIGAEAASCTVLKKFVFNATHRRERFRTGTAGMRKPPASTWSAAAAWTGERPQ
jgi:recombination protein RecA